MTRHKRGGHLHHTGVLSTPSLCLSGSPPSSSPEDMLVPSGAHALRHHSHAISCNCLRGSRQVALKKLHTALGSGGIALQDRPSASASTSTPASSGASFLAALLAIVTEAPSVSEPVAKQLGRNAKSLGEQRDRALLNPYTAGQVSSPPLLFSRSSRPIHPHHALPQVHLREGSAVAPGLPRATCDAAAKASRPPPFPTPLLECRPTPLPPRTRPHELDVRCALTRARTNAHRF